MLTFLCNLSLPPKTHTTLIHFWYYPKAQLFIRKTIFPIFYVCRMYNSLLCVALYLIIMYSQVFYNLCYILTPNSSYIWWWNAYFPLTFPLQWKLFHLFETWCPNFYLLAMICSCVLNFEKFRGIYDFSQNSTACRLAWFLSDTIYSN